MKSFSSIPRFTYVLFGGALLLSAPSCDEPTDAPPGSSGGSRADDATSDDGDGGEENASGGRLVGGDGDGETSPGGAAGDGDGDTASGGASTSDNPGVQTLGQPCNDPGALACAGENQKLQLLCDSTKWVQNGTCNGTEVCDTGEENRGSCQEPLPGCVDKEPGETYCEAGTSYECGIDRVTSALVEVCESYCNEEATECSADGACPLTTETTFECATACEADETRCEQGEGECSFLDLSKASYGDLKDAYVRLPSGNDLCLEHLDGWECDRKAFIVLLRNSAFQVHLPAGWRGQVVPNLVDDNAQYAALTTCGEEFIEGCLEVEADPQAVGFPALVLTADEDVPAGNLLLTYDTPCSAN